MNHVLQPNALKLAKLAFYREVFHRYGAGCSRAHSAGGTMPDSLCINGSPNINTGIAQALYSKCKFCGTELPSGRQTHEVLAEHSG